MLTTLMKLGLSEKEAKVYLATLELAEDTVQNIAKQAGVNRPTAYVVLDKLLKMGLVSTLEQGKKTLFVAENPDELTNILNREKKAIESKENELKEIMSQLSAIHHAKEGKPIVRYFEGSDGLEALDRYGYDKMKKGSEMLNITPIDLIEKSFPDRRKSAVSDRVKLGIVSRAIYTHKDGEIPGYQNEKELRNGVFIPREKLPIDATVSIYPDWGIKIFYYGAIKPYGVMIESKEIARNFALFFELAWLGAKSYSSPKN